MISSPFLTGPTPSGVPVNNKSPGTKEKNCDKSLIISLTEKIILEVLESCLTSPLTSKNISKS